MWKKEGNKLFNISSKKSEKDNWLTEAMAYSDASKKILRNNTAIGKVFFARYLRTRAKILFYLNKFNEAARLFLKANDIFYSTGSFSSMFECYLFLMKIDGIVKGENVNIPYKKAYDYVKNIIEEDSTLKKYWEQYITDENLEKELFSRISGKNIGNISDLKTRIEEGLILTATKHPNGYMSLQGCNNQYN